MSVGVRGNFTGMVQVIDPSGAIRGSYSNRAGLLDATIKRGNFANSIVKNPTIMRGNYSNKINDYVELFFNATLNSKQTIFKFVKSISIGGPTTPNNDSTFGRNLICGISRENSEGSPSAPSLKISQNAMWRFKWVASQGARTLSIKCKQVINLSPRPTMTIKANPSMGINSDLIATAASSTDWVTIGPISFTAIAAGLVYVELSNNIVNYTTDVASGGSDGVNAYFDHIVVT